MSADNVTVVMDRGYNGYSLFAWFHSVAQHVSRSQGQRRHDIAQEKMPQRGLQLWRLPI